ncbi:MAG: serine hydrolase [Acidobacteria bacterium]|nr:serine hydrolase [Acidobacteriota bacterium]
MKTSQFVRLFTIVLIALCGLGPLSAQNTAPFEGFDDYVNRSMKEWEIPGMAVAIVKDDKVVFAKGYGVRDIGKPAPVDEHTLFAIGSSSKAFTAASLAILMDEGKLKWDDPVTKYLPGFQLYDPYVTREMTVRDLLTHRIGLERGDQIWYATPYSREEILRRIRYLPPSSSMRSKFGYQNIMFLAAGQIVPSVTGKSWDDFVAERIFTPLGMKESDTTIRALARSNDVASPHVKVDDKVQTVPWRNIDNISPAGSINSNVVDMAQWVRLQLGKGKFAGKQVISEAAIKEMQTPQTIIRIEGLYPIMYPDAHFLNYGMGWFLSDFRGSKLVEHGGAIDGMRALVAMIPEKNIGVVILTNLNGTVLPQFLAYRIFDSYLGEQPTDWASDGFKKIKAAEEQAKAAAAKADAARVMGTRPSLELKDYAGKYRSEIYGDVEVKLTDGKLTIGFGPNYDGAIEHWNYDTFRVTWKDPVLGKGLIRFDLDTKGKAASLDLGIMGAFKRVP